MLCEVCLYNQVTIIKKDGAIFHYLCQDCYNEQQDVIEKEITIPADRLEYWGNVK